MRFEEVLPALRAGKKVCRKSIPNLPMYIDGAKGLSFVGKGSVLLTLCELEADDWEVVEEQPVSVTSTQFWNAVAIAYKEHQDGWDYNQLLALAEYLATELGIGQRDR